MKKIFNGIRKKEQGNKFVIFLCHSESLENLCEV